VFCVENMGFAMNGTMRLLLVGAAAVMAATAVSSLPARAQDDSALQQLKDIDHSSNDAANEANAGHDEAAKDLAGQGFDTPNNDPAPPDTPLPSVPEPPAPTTVDGN
jgi:type II secretory pathway pseudopilin PulG